MLNRARLLLAAIVLLAPVSASAQLTLFTDRTAFLAAVTNAETDTYSDLPTGIVDGPLNRTVGPYSYRASTVGIGDFWGGTGVPSGYLSTNVNDASILFDNIDALVRGFGGNFFGSRDNVLTQMTLDVIATTASGTLSQQLVNPGLDAFVGFVSTEALLSVQILRVDGNFTTADNVVLAQAATVVPEPSSFALIGAGLFALTIAARRRRV